MFQEIQPFTKWRCNLAQLLTTLTEVLIED